MVQDPPRLRLARPLEDSALVAQDVRGEPVTGFEAFLDGTQSSHVEDYVGAIPIVAGRTAAVIRQRVDRRMTTWREGARKLIRLYAPHRMLPEGVLEILTSAGLDVRDTLPSSEVVSGHPLELLRRAVDAVKDDRESLERDLADLWASDGQTPLFVDGGLPTGPLASVSPWCVGVVKSHQTLYLPEEGLPVVLSLAEGSRTSAIVIERTWGPQVVSWYLRLRTAPSHDPFLGLVRVEVAFPTGLETAALRDRADLVSRWILAERAPLALPDSRWDRMVYGIRDCEEYLRATAG